MPSHLEYFYYFVLLVVRCVTGLHFSFSTRRDLYQLPRIFTPSISLELGKGSIESWNQCPHFELNLHQDFVYYLASTCPSSLTGGLWRWFVFLGINDSLLLVSSNPQNVLVFPFPQHIVVQIHGCRYLWENMRWLLQLECMGGQSILHSMG